MEPGRAAGPAARIRAAQVRPARAGSPAPFTRPAPPPRPARREPADPAAPAVTGDPPAPVIQVSVDRIEVRAVTPPPAAPPERPAAGATAPPLSDYLASLGDGR
jgi:hypothetical protein